MNWDPCLEGACRPGQAAEIRGSNDLHEYYRLAWHRSACSRSIGTVFSFTGIRRQLGGIQEVELPHPRGTSA